MSGPTHAALLPLGYGDGSTVPFVGGPADGVRLGRAGLLRYNGKLRPAVEWSTPPDDYSIMGASHLYLWTVAVRQDPHPCRKGYRMIAEWDAYIWDKINPDDITVTDQHALGLPSRFEVEPDRPRSYTLADVIMAATPSPYAHRLPPPYGTAGRPYPWGGREIE